MSTDQRDQKIRQLLSSSGWPAALLILTCPMFSRDGRVWGRVDLRDESIDFDAMVNDGTFSGGERRMVRIAASLYANDEQFNVNLYSAFGALDDWNLRLVLEAIEMHVTGLTDERRVLLSTILAERLA